MTLRFYFPFNINRNIITGASFFNERRLDDSFSVIRVKKL